MNHEEETLNRLRDELATKINRVPERVRNGGVMETRQWVAKRDEAAKLLKKRGASARDFISAISSIE